MGMLSIGKPRFPGIHRTARIEDGIVASITLTARQLFDPFTCFSPQISDLYVVVIEQAVYALYQVTRWRVGAEGLVAAGAVNRVAELLASVDSDVRRWARRLLGTLVSYDPPLPIRWDLKSCKSLVTLLR